MVCIRESYLLLKCRPCLNLQIYLTFWQSDHNPMISSQIPYRPLTVKLKAIWYFSLKAMACHAASCTIIIIKFANLSPCVIVAQSVRPFEWYPKGPKFNTSQGHLFQVQIFSVQFLLRTRGSLVQTRVMMAFPRMLLFSAFEWNFSRCIPFRIANVGIWNK